MQNVKFKAGYKFVVCYVGNFHESEDDLIKKGLIDMVTKVVPSPIMDSYYTPTRSWDKAIPVDPETGNVIASYVNGEMYFKD